MLRAEIIGHLGADASVQRVNGNEFVSFRVAHSVSTVDTQTGQVYESTTWVSCTINGDGGKLTPYLTKGTRVYCRGYLSCRLYVDNQGQKRAGLNLSVSEVELCSSRVKLEDVTRYIDVTPEARQQIYDYLCKYADQQGGDQSNG